MICWHLHYLHFFAVDSCTPSWFLFSFLSHLSLFPWFPCLVWQPCFPYCLGTSWNILEHLGTSWNILEHLGTSWNWGKMNAQHRSSTSWFNRARRRSWKRLRGMRQRSKGSWWIMPHSSAAAPGESQRQFVIFLCYVDIIWYNQSYYMYTCNVYIYICRYIYIRIYIYILYCVYMYTYIFTLHIQYLVKEYRTHDIEIDSKRLHIILWWVVCWPWVSRLGRRGQEACQSWERYAWESWGKNSASNRASETEGEGSKGSFFQWFG